VQQAAPPRVVPAALWSAWRQSERPHSEASSVRRDAAVAPSSCFRRVEGLPSAALWEPAWWQEPAAAWRQPAGAAEVQVMVMASPSEMKAAAVAASVRQVASARQALLPAEGEAAVSGAKVQPPGAAESESEPLARQPGEAEVASDAEEAQPPEGAEAVSGAAAELQPAVAAAEPDAVAGQLPGVAAEGLPDAEEVRRPGAAEARAPSARQPAGHPSAAPLSWRLEGRPLPWLAPRRAVRSAHAMRRSRTASPSRQSWRAAGCEGLS
jgi:hypothetical protein